MRTYFLILLTFFSVLAGTGAAAVHVAQIHGTAAVRSSDDADGRPLKPTTILKPGMIITTSAHASVTILFTTGDSIVIYDESEVRIDDQYFKEELDNNNAVTVFSGQTRIFVPPGVFSREGQRFTVTTPTAVAGVRGTAFDIAVGEDGATALDVNAGTVRFGPDEPGGKNFSAGSQAVLDIRGKLEVWRQRRKNFIRSFITDRRRQLKKNPHETLETFFTRAEQHVRAFKESEQRLSDSIQQRNTYIAEIRTAIKKREFKNAWIIRKKLTSLNRSIFKNARTAFQQQAQLKTIAVLSKRIQSRITAADQSLLKPKFKTLETSLAAVKKRHARLRTTIKKSVNRRKEIRKWFENKSKQIKEKKKAVKDKIKQFRNKPRRWKRQ